MENAELKRIVEALIFASDEPVTVDRLAKALDEPDKKIVRDLVHALRDEYEEEGRGFTLQEVGGAYQFRTRPAHAPWIQRMNQAKPARFSGPALETLSIIAYKQPALRQEIDDIRGVDSGGVLKSLLERHLIKIVGRKDVPGRPLLYGTTKEFLSLFNLKNLAELPSLRDLKELETDPTSQIEMLFPERGDLGELAELPDAPAELTEPIPESIAADAPESFSDEEAAEPAEGPIEGGKAE
ncbi:MAG: SMC-Scp complex subunit ScpB, partial [Candidatus Methylomirabilis sp.]|nr:SMC-Scp complex subunit ScpB [Deltaproteobacteria bacterium]